MKIFIVLLALHSSVILADPQRDWYTTQLSAHVLPPYSAAYRMLQARILNELLSVNIALLDEAAVTQLANRLLCAARDVRTSLDQSVSASDQVRYQLDTQVADGVNEVGAHEQNIINKETEIRQTDQSLIGAQQALASAQQAVQDKEQSARAAQEAMDVAEDAVEKAKKCHGLLGKRSDANIPVTRRGWFSSITRPILKPIENAIKDVIIKPVCSVINTGPLDWAKKQRDQAYVQLASARDQVVHFAQLAATHQTHKISLENQLVQFHISLKAVQVALVALRDELAVTISINGQVSNVKKIKIAYENLKEQTNPLTLSRSESEWVWTLPMK